MLSTYDILFKSGTMLIGVSAETAFQAVTVPEVKRIVDHEHGTAVWVSSIRTATNKVKATKEKTPAPDENSVRNEAGFNITKGYFIVPAGMDCTQDTLVALGLTQKWYMKVRVAKDHEASTRIYQFPTEQAFKNAIYDLVAMKEEHICNWGSDGTYVMKAIFYAYDDVEGHWSLEKMICGINN